MESDAQQDLEKDQNGSRWLIAIPVRGASQVVEKVGRKGMILD